MPPEIFVLALEYRRQPERFRHLTDPRTPLPASFNALVPHLGSALSVTRIATTAAPLGCSAAELHSAVLFLLRQVLLPPTANHYRVLGVTQAASPDLIADHYRVLIQLFHPDRHPAAERARTVADAARINAAYSVLKGPSQRQRYDLDLAANAHHRRRWPIRASASKCWSPGASHRFRTPASPRSGLFAGATIVLFAAAWAWSVTDRNTYLRMANPGAARLASAPAFLTSPPHPAPGAGTQANGPPASRGQAIDPSGLGPTATADTPLSIQARTLPVRDTDTPDLLLERFAQHFRAGDLAGILRLMTDHARITSADPQDPRGGCDLFQGTVERSLRLGPLHLSRPEMAPLRAVGRLDQTSTPGSADRTMPAPWVGRIALEIVREETAYRISALDYWLESAK